MERSNMEEDKKVPQGLPLEVLIAVAHSDPREMPNASKPTAHKDKLKNVTPKMEHESNAKE